VASYPYRRYLLYQLSRKMVYYDIIADCLSKGLVPPSEDELRALDAELGTPPRGWKARLKDAGPTFRRWLLANGVIDLWDQSTISQEVLSFQQSGKSRGDFESLMLLHGDVGHCRKELLLSYPESRVPSLEALCIYAEYFWDIGSMPRTDLFDYIEKSKDRARYLPAYEGDLERSYSILGIHQKVEAAGLADSFVQFAYRQVRMLDRQGVVQTGAQLIGISALQRAALDSVQVRDEVRLSHEDDNLRRDAALFKAQVVRAKQIVSIDDLEGGTIDAEYEDVGEAGIRRISGG
jgi:hypothetical protein